jgi:FkbM family methyltransferase
MPDTNTPTLGKLLKDHGFGLAFTILEIGALPIGAKQEPFYSLLDFFPDSRIVCFETDPRVCEELNRKARPGVRYYPNALGRTEEVRLFYETVHPMCSSLYEPDERWADRFQNLEVMRLKAVSRVETVSLDRFQRIHSIHPPDLIKIDIQGAKLEVFQGGSETLRDTLCIVTEVEFVPLYKSQPLFGEVNTFLQSRGLAFHKFLGFSGRSMKPVVIKEDPNFPAQHMWTDALFVKNVFNPTAFSDEQLQKAAVLLDLFRCPDVAYYLLDQFDARRQTRLATAYLRQSQGS